MTRARWLGPALAAAPFLIGLATYFLVGESQVRISPEWIALGNTSWDNTETVRGITGYDIVVTSEAVLIFVQALLLWQVIEITRGWSDAARGSLRFVAESAGVVLAAALALKLVWVALGYSGALPSELASGGVWAASRADGRLSWLVAFVVVGLAASLVVTLSDRRWSTRDVRVGALLFGLALVSGPLITSFWQLVTGVAAIGPSSVERWLISIQDEVLALTRWTRIAMPYAALLVGGVLLATRRLVLAGVVMLLLGIWGLPRAVTLTGDVLHYPDISFSVGSLEDFIERDDQYAGWANAVTINTAATLVIAALALLWLYGRQRFANPRLLLYLLLLSTAVAHAASVFSSESDALYFLLLVFPVAYTFLFDSARLNERSPDRSSKVLVALAMTLLALSVTGLFVANLTVFPGRVDYADYGKVFVQTPQLLLIVLGTAALVGGTAARRADSQP